MTVAVYNGAAGSVIDSGTAEKAEKEGTVDRDMKKNLTDLLVCPVCKGDLELFVESEVDGDVVTGTLRCITSGVDYPVTDGIPDLLPRDHPPTSPQQTAP